MSGTVVAIPKACWGENTLLDTGRVAGDRVQDDRP